MRFLRPVSLFEACEMAAAEPGLVPVAGGTDVMVGVNFGKVRPSGMVDLSRIEELTGHATDGAELRIGAGVTYTRILDELAAQAPALAIAARTVGSPQIRNRGTLGGNLGTASPAGDGLPPLLATDATVELVSVRGTRNVRISDFFLGPKRSVLAPDELVAAVRLPSRRGPQQFAKIGTRNAMTIAVATVAVALDVERRHVGVALGAVAPTPVCAVAAQDFAATALDWAGGSEISPDVARRFSALAADACAPIDDVRGKSDYRRHAVSVLATRCLRWAWDDHRRNGKCG